MSKTGKIPLQSAWTPLSNDSLNQRQASKQSNPADPLKSIFEERKALISKWFSKWSDSQRNAALEEIVQLCKSSQIKHVNAVAIKRRMALSEDFTRVLPRVVSVYLFSFLDPRSLCRCSQVCWYWKYLSELDQLWITKALRLGWALPYTPSPYEQGAWKRLYVENILALKQLTPKLPKGLLAQLHQMDCNSARSSARSDLSRLSSSKKPPWRGSDPVPKDTWRNNYLDNDDEILKVTKLRSRGAYGTDAEQIVRRARRKVNTRRSQSLTRSQSHTTLNTTNGRQSQIGQVNLAATIPSNNSSFTAVARPHTAFAIHNKQQSRESAKPQTNGTDKLNDKDMGKTAAETTSDERADEVVTAQTLNDAKEEEYDSKVY